MKQPVGYLRNTKEGLAGERGLFYDYILAGNGLFIEGQCPLLRAVVQVAPAEVRGLLPMQEDMDLPQSRIPIYLYDLAVSTLAAHPDRESYLAVIWEGEYRLRATEQEGTPSGVSYQQVPHTVMDIHSHGEMGAFFSPTDNRDEQGLRLSMVVGKLDTRWPEMAIRVGVYGYFVTVPREAVFV